MNFYMDENIVFWRWGWVAKILYRLRYFPPSKDYVPYSETDHILKQNVFDSDTYPKRPENKPIKTISETISLQR